MIEKTNAELNGILQARLFGDEVKYLTNGKLSKDYEPGSDPVYYDIDIGWIPVPNYAGDSGDAQFLRYQLAPYYKFVIEPHEQGLAVTCESKEGRGASLAIECNEARATVVAIYHMIEKVEER